MSNFSNNAITDVGKMLLADVQAGAVFTPTRIVIGSGNMPGGATAQSMTDVITPVRSLAINKKKRSPDGKCVFGGVYTNEQVTDPFYFRELALYAKAVYLNTDGSVKSEGVEVLYSYGNAGANADYMPAYSTSSVIEKQIDLVTWIGNDAQVDLTIETGVYLTQTQGVQNVQYINPDTTGYASLLEYMASIYNDNIIVSGHISGFSDMPEGVTLLHGTINVVGGQLTVSGSARTVHYYRGTNSLTSWTSEWRKVYDSGNKPTLAELGAAPAGFGLGSDSTLVANCDYATENGWYYVNENTLNRANGIIYGALFVLRRTSVDRTQLLFDVSNGAIATRVMLTSVWQQWEWVNPPFGVGIEYRTIEHRDGKAVFKKLDTDGILKYRLDGSSTWIPLAQDIGAVKKAGDTMSNDLTIEKQTAPSLRLNEGSNGAGAIVQQWGNQLIIANRIAANVVDNYRFFSVNNLNQQDDVAYALGLADIRNGVSKYYTVLHSGNLHVFGLGAVPATVE